jgi:endonuclease YncB( thermonuclease family)
MDGKRIRLFGLDAPERRQECHRDGRAWACGEEAHQALTRLLAAAQPDCREVDRDRYGRSVAICLINNIDMGGELVRAGLAIAYVRYSRRYVEIEAEARAARRGVWAGSFVAPWDWRAGRRLAPNLAPNQ